MKSIVNAFIMISLATLGLWSAGTAVVEGGLSFERIFGAALSYNPALPKLTSFIWLYVFYSYIVLYLGGLFQFSDWNGNISPLGHVRQTPIEEFSFMPLILLTCLWSC
ncbi:hypothetical protein [Metabacillus sediminilitoris]|uniref:hypothetical protein n=1 Tax=Metabacillus sediminilitoris TaxID=2567941 RepID=UPI001D0D9A6C|nr:hypothetical protein [Metabacillus sediminilitoris]